MMQLVVLIVEFVAIGSVVNIINSILSTTFMYVLSSRPVSA